MQENVLENLNENTDQTNDENQNSAVESGVLGRPEKSPNFGGQEKSVYYYWQSDKTGVEKLTNDDLQNESSKNILESLHENILENCKKMYWKIRMKIQLKQKSTLIFQKMRPKVMVRNIFWKIRQQFFIQIQIMIFLLLRRVASKENVIPNILLIVIG